MYVAPWHTIVLGIPVLYLAKYKAWDYIPCVKVKIMNSCVHYSVTQRFYLSKLWANDSSEENKGQVQNSSNT